MFIHFTDKHHCGGLRLKKPCLPLAINLPLCYNEQAKQNLNNG